jgi:Mg/Co/Ni transporter MgtE
MRLAPLIGPDLQDAIAIGPEAVREAVSEFHPEDIAELLEDLSAREAVVLVRALPTETAADVVERLTPHRQVLVFNAIDTGRAVELLGEMDPDDRVDLLQELDEDDAAALLAALERREPEAAEEVRELVQYEPETAGGLMTTEFASLPPETKVWEAMEAAIGRCVSARPDLERARAGPLRNHDGERLPGLILRRPGTGRARDRPL